MKPTKPNVEPWKPVVVGDNPSVRTSGLIGKADVRAIMNCWAGEANSDQQRRAIEAIIYSIARCEDNTYRPDAKGGERDTTFAQGMRHVALEVRKFAERGSIYLDNETDT